MKPQYEIAKRIGAFFVVFSFWHLYKSPTLEVLAVILMVILIGSAIVLPFKNRLLSSHNRLLKRVGEASTFEFTFTALGLGTVASSGRIFAAGFVWWGLAAILAGGLFLGFGIAESLEIFLNSIHPQNRDAHSKRPE
jgi:hypothetical protein